MWIISVCDFRIGTTSDTYSQQRYICSGSKTTTDSSFKLLNMTFSVVVHASMHSFGAPRSSRSPNKSKLFLPYARVTHIVCGSLCFQKARSRCTIDPQPNKQETHTNGSTKVACDGAERGQGTTHGLWTKRTGKAS
jgi:hypothetical protein